VKKNFLLSTNQSFKEPNIFTDKSAVILHWLLTEGISKRQFALREIVKETHISLGLTQKVLKSLVTKGLVKTNGVRTAKKYSVPHPKKILELWLDSYNILEKCKMWTYTTSFDKKSELIKILEHSKLTSKIRFALHTAAEMNQSKNTNLETLEIYLTDPNLRSKIEELLELEPKEKGYEVLLILPYYKGLLKTEFDPKHLQASPPLLTYLDLYHFPLRGLEQSEFMRDRLPEIKNIYRH